MTIASGLTLSVFLARSLGAEDYGRYLYALSVAQVLAVPLMSGLPALVTRQLAQLRAESDWARMRGILRWANLLVAAAAFAVMLCGTFWYLCTEMEVEQARLYLLAIFLIPLLVQIQLSTATLNGFEHPIAAALPDGTIRPLTLLLFVGAAAAMGKLSPQSTIVAYILSSLTAVAWATVYYRRKCKGEIAMKSGGGTIIDGRAWLSSLLPLSMITILGMLNSRVDTLILGYSWSKAEVAHYGLAMQVSGLVGLGQVLILGIIGPRIARLWVQGKKEEVISMIRTASTIAIRSVSIGWILVSAFGWTVIQLLLGPEYAIVALLASITALSPLVASIFGPAPLLLLMTQNERRYLWNSAVMVMTNVGLNVLLIPSLGAVGAAISSVTSTIVFHAQMTRDAYRICGISTWAVRRRHLEGVIH